MVGNNQLEESIKASSGTLTAGDLVKILSLKGLKKSEITQLGEKLKFG